MIIHDSGKAKSFALFVACVMPDHVHLLFEPQIKVSDAKGNVFSNSLTILQNIKSVSAHQINKARGTSGPVWEKESFDRLIRSEADLQEKYLYICRNPWESGIARANEDYRWLWTLESVVASGESPDAARGRVAPRIRGAAPQNISGSSRFVFTTSRDSRSISPN